MAFSYSRSPLAAVVGALDTGTPTSSANIDTAFVFETSGDAFAARFVAPESQSAATLTFYAFCTALTGTPTFQVEVREGYNGSGDIDRPRTGGSNIGSSSSTVTSPAANTWVSWTVTCSLTAGDVYWVLVKNTHATPASNHATFQYRGALDSIASGAIVTPQQYFALGGYTTDGFATDPTVSTASIGTWVIKFSSGALLGMPFVASSAHASNQNSRGVRVQFTEDVVMSGVISGIAASATGVSIYQGGSLVVSEAGDSSSASRPVYRIAPITLTGGTDYDVVITFGVNSTQGTFYTMGQAEGSVPTDVKACMPSFIVGAIDGAGPTFTPDTSQLQLLQLIVDDNPAIAGGSSGGGPLFDGRLIA